MYTGDQMVSRLIKRIIDISESLLSKIGAGHVFRDTNLDMDKIYETIDNYRENQAQEIDGTNDIENDATENEDHDNL